MCNKANTVFEFSMFGKNGKHSVCNMYVWRSDLKHCVWTAIAKAVFELRLHGVLPDLY